VERVGAATREVIDGRAAFERDGVLFFEPEFRWPVAYALAASTARHGEIRVLDLGGSLGSVFWQHRDVLPPVPMTWTVIEQDAFVELGRAIATPPLTFATSIDQAAEFGPWHVGLLSSVLQYLPDPWQALANVLSSGVDMVVIDRTPIYSGAQDLPTLQRVPEHIYPASYPAWILSEPQLEEAMRGWRIVARFPGIEPPMRTKRGINFTWSGLIAIRSDS